MADRVKLPELPKPLRTSKHWDEGIERGIAGERAARLEREDQLLKALTDLSRAEARVEQMRQALEAIEYALDEWRPNGVPGWKPARDYLNARDIFNEDLSDERVLLEVARAALAAEEGKENGK